MVLNSRSGSRDAEQSRETIEQILLAGGRTCRWFLCDEPSRIATVAQEVARAAETDRAAVVVAGGDGTINAVVQAVLPTSRPFGIVPQGTFNYSSRTHGIPLETAEAARSLLTARVKPIQVGLINDQAFLVNASLGLYPQLLQDREQYKRQYGRRRIVALWAGLISLWRWRRQLTLQIEHDEQQELVRTPTLFVGNNALQLEQIGLDEAYDVQRLRLAAIMVRPVATRELFALALRGALGRLGEDERVRDFAFRRMTVTPLGRDRRGVKIAIDGEVSWMRPPLTFSVAPRPLNLLVPADR